MKAKVVGAGIQGVAIAYALLKIGKFDFVELIDSNTNRARKGSIFINNLLASEGYSFPFTRHKRATSYIPGSAGKPDIVVAATPFNVNLSVAEECTKNNIPYADLGGNPSTSLAIQRQAKASVFTDLGLAPGWVGIIAEEMIKNDPTETHLFMRVGGLPVRPSGKFQYGITFSPKGLYNEYTGDCRVLKHGDIINRPALSDYEVVESRLGKLECFRTKGGLGLSLDGLKNRGVFAASYKTLRYLNHHDYLTFLLEECKMTEEQFTEIVEQAFPPVEDLVIIQVEVARADSLFEKSKRQKEEVIIYSDEVWTAMQKATAFPAAAVATLMAEKKMPDKTVYNYEDVPFTQFNKYLEVMGLYG